MQGEITRDILMDRKLDKKVSGERERLNDRE